MCRLSRCKALALIRSGSGGGRCPRSRSFAIAHWTSSCRSRSRQQTCNLQLLQSKRGCSIEGSAIRIRDIAVHPTMTLDIAMPARECNGERKRSAAQTEDFLVVVSSGEMHGCWTSDGQYDYLIAGKVRTTHGAQSEASQYPPCRYATRLHADPAPACSCSDLAQRLARQHLVQLSGCLSAKVALTRLEEE